MISIILFSGLTLNDICAVKDKKKQSFKKQQELLEPWNHTPLFHPLTRAVFSCQRFDCEK